MFLISLYNDIMFQYYTRLVNKMYSLSEIDVRYYVLKSADCIEEEDDKTEWA